jgi:glycerophosphoryl diester phosphodiesterase
MWFMTAIVTVGLTAVLGVGHVGEPLIVAHRGASHDAPENTLTAFRLGLQQGADAIEGDFHLTTDGQIVCMHDRTAKRTAGVDREVAAMTLAEVRQLDVGSWKGPSFAGERAPTLAEVLAIVPVDRKFLIEIKCGVEIMPELARVLNPHEATFDRLRIISFDADVIAAAKRTLPQIKAYWLTSRSRLTPDRKSPLPPMSVIFDTLKNARADGLDAQAELFDAYPDLIKSLREHGYEAHAWTVDEPDVATRLARQGIDSITTNRPRYLRDALSN